MRVPTPRAPSTDPAPRRRWKHALVALVIAFAPVLAKATDAYQHPQIPRDPTHQQH